MSKFKNSQEAAAKRRELQEKIADLNDKLDLIDETLEKRELKDEEKQNAASLKRELEKAQREFNMVSGDYQMLYQQEQADANKREPKKTTGELLRECFKKARTDERYREITLGGANMVNDSGAVTLKINDIIPTLNEGLGLPKGVNIVTGVTGNELWPVSLNDGEMEEVGELVELSDQKLQFDKISPDVHRSGISFLVSYEAIDNASFDLQGFVEKKITNAEKKYLAEKVYSQAAFTGVKGPFSGKTADGNITLDATAYKNILLAIAQFSDKGYDSSNICLVMDAVTEAELKATPKAAGQGGFVIENGKCCGYDYVVSHYINTTLDTDGKTLKATADRYIGIGLFEYLPVQQHGTARLVIDTQSAATKNALKITFNTGWSVTDISVKTTTNGKKNTTTTAFGLYKVVEPAA